MGVSLYQVKNSGGVEGTVCLLFHAVVFLIPILMLHYARKWYKNIEYPEASKSICTHTVFVTGVKWDSMHKDSNLGRST